MNSKTFNNMFFFPIYIILRIKWHKPKANEIVRQNPKKYDETTDTVT